MYLTGGGFYKFPKSAPNIPNSSTSADKAILNLHQCHNWILSPALTVVATCSIFSEFVECKIIAGI